MSDRDREKARLDQLWREAMGGNEDAGARLLGYLDPLFRKLATRLSPWLGLEAEDLVQEAALAVWRNLARYDPHRGVSFKTWAVSVGKPAMSAKGRIPAYYRGILRQALRAEMELLQELGRSPTTAEIAKRAALSEEKVRNGKACRDAAWPMSLDSMLEDRSDGDSAFESGGVRKVPDGLITHANAMHHDELEALLCALEKLEPQSQQAISLHYFQERSHAEAAVVLGVSELNSRKILQRALKRLLELVQKEL